MAGSNRPKWIKIVIVAFLILVTVFYAAGGIVFANMIHGDALIPQPPTPDNGVYVLAVDESSITLTSTEKREDTRRPGVAGLAWPGGYGRLGEIVVVEGLDVTRGFTLTAGPPPPACTLTTCDQVDIESWTFESDPSDVGLGYTEVEFDSPLGRMGAWLVDSGDGTIWAIHAHGWRASRREALRSLPTYDDAGITSLVIDYRNDEGAPSDPSDLYRFGRTEWEDVQGAVQYALDHGADEIVLVGYSTGSAVHMGFLENSALAERVIAVVFDAPNIDMGETVRHEASKTSLPGTSIPVPSSLTAVAMFLADLQWDIDWEQIDYVERADQIVDVPVLVFHGVADDRVPIAVSRGFRDQVSDLVELVEVEAAGHVTSWNVDPGAYESKLLGFLGRVKDEQ